MSLLTKAGGSLLSNLLWCSLSSMAEMTSFFEWRLMIIKYIKLNSSHQSVMKKMKISSSHY